MTYWKHFLFLFIILLVAAYWTYYYVKEPFSKTTTPTKKYANAANAVNAKEGFNMVDREGTMLRGKQSNQIPVLSTDSNYDNLEAGDKYTFSGNYTAV
jgi:uncharacterized protein (UPF0333 family)